MTAKYLTSKFSITEYINYYYTTTILRPPALCLGLPGWASTKKVKPIWIYWSKRVSGSAISWAICKSAPRPRQITTPASNHSVSYRRDALPATQSTASKHNYCNHFTAVWTLYGTTKVSWYQKNIHPLTLSWSSIIPYVLPPGAKYYGNFTASQNIRLWRSQYSHAEVNNLQTSRMFSMSFRCWPEDSSIIVCDLNKKEMSDILSREVLF